MENSIIFTYQQVLYTFLLKKVRDVAYVLLYRKRLKLKLLLICECSTMRPKTFLWSTGIPLTNIWNNRHGFKLSRSTQNYPKLPTASNLVLCYSTKTLISNCQPGVQAGALIFLVIPQGTQRYYQNNRQAILATFRIQCHPIVQ